MPAKHRHSYTGSSVARGAGLSADREPSGVRQARVPLDPAIVAAYRHAAGVDLDTPVESAKRPARKPAGGDGD